MRTPTLMIFAGAIALSPLAACSPEAGSEHADGKGLKVDVVAPREPEVISNTGQLAVGELANTYDHEATMARAHANDVPVDETGTSWNDDNWAYAEGTGPEMTPKDVIDKKDPPSVKVTKIPSDY